MEEVQNRFFLILAFVCTLGLPKIEKVTMHAFCVDLMHTLNFKKEKINNYWGQNVPSVINGCINLLSTL